MSCSSNPIKRKTIELIKSYFQKEEAVDELRARLLEEKTLDWLLENSELVEESAESGEG